MANKLRKLLKRIKRSIPVLAVLFTIALAIVIAYFYATGGEYYDYSHLIPITQELPATPFLPLAETSGPQVEGMEAAAENEYLVLYIDQANVAIAVYDKRNGHIWHSNPLSNMEDEIANDFEQELMRSFLSFRFFNDNRNVNTLRSHRDCARLGQADLFNIPGGLRIDMMLGSTGLGLRGIPTLLSRERYDELLSRIDNPDDVETVRRWYGRARRMEGFLRLSGLLDTNATGRRDMIRIFEEIGYTFEDLIYDNELAGIGGAEEDIILVNFRLPVDFVLDGDSLRINVAVSRRESESDNLVQGMELLRYFGAGSIDDEGYIFVPSGSGALIEFNNGKINHERYTGVIYGIDPLGQRTKAQITHDTSLPVFGIKNNEAAMLAIIESGSALATVNADISGRVSSFNSAWFDFDFRGTDTATISGPTQDASLTVIQQQAYEGDITVRFVFLAGDDADYAGMARAYQSFLVENDVLKPLEPTENAPFYLSLLGAIEKQEFFLGTPYFATVPMTTYSQGIEIIEDLNANGVDAVRLQWLGWFNRGANHDLADRIKPVRNLGSQSDKDSLSGLLEAGGGSMYPAVNFQALRRDSRRVSLSRDVSQDILGYSGIFTSFNRELLSIMLTLYRSDVYVLIHPRVMPFHVESFIPAYRQLGQSALSLGDLGSLLSHSSYNRGGIDREGSKLIAKEQLQKLHEEFGSLMIPGGNDYSIFAASHILDLPTAADKFLLLDHSIPFIQMVLHGYVDHAGTAINTRDIYDFDHILLDSLATGTAPHFMWTYEPTTSLAFTQYEVLYSTRYKTWLSDAAELYRIYNEIFKDLRTVPISDFEILKPGLPGSVGQGAVTVTEFGATRIYVNFGDTGFVHEDFTIPPMDYIIRNR